MPNQLRALLAATLSALSSVAQNPATAVPEPPAPPPPPQGQHFVKLSYPRDKDRVVAMLDSEPILLGQVLQHIEERHCSGILQMLADVDEAGNPRGDLMLQSDLLPTWVRQYVDVHMFELEAEKNGTFAEKAGDGPSRREQLEASCSAALKSAFQGHLDEYVAGLREHGFPTDLKQSRVNRMLTDYQLRNGLACELQGWIDFLVPMQEWTNQELNDFYQAHPRYFGGGVTIAQILIMNRDAGTGILLEEDGRVRAALQLDEVQKKLRPDGSNFEELARLHSHDTRGAADGGVLKNVERFDHRLPAAICRAAWNMKDGEVSGVIETQYGWHLVKRIEHVQRMFLLFSEQMLPTVRQVMRRQLQEDALFAARARHHIELKI